MSVHIYIDLIDLWIIVNLCLAHSQNLAHLCLYAFVFVNISKVQWCLWGTCNLYCFIGCRQRQLLLQKCSWPIYGIQFSNYIVQTEVFLSFGEGEAGAKPIVLQHHEQLRRLKIRTYLLSTTPCVLRLELIYAKYAKYAGRGRGGPVGVLSGQTLHLLRVPPIGALTFYFPSLRSIVKSLRANHCHPQCLASELEMSQCCDVFS